MILRAWWRRQQFQPGFLAVLFNPSFLLRRRLYRALRARLDGQGGVTVDVGCGSKPYRPLVESTLYVGIEVRQSGHVHEKEPVDLYYDGRRLPVADGLCDLVLCSEVLEHASEPSELMREMRRILKPGGKIVLTVPFAWGEHERPYDERRWTWYGFKHLLDDCGLADIEIERVGHHLEAICQLLAAYVHQRFIPRNKYVNAALVPILVSPILLLGCALSFLPGQDNLYMNLVASARRPME